MITGFPDRAHSMQLEVEQFRFACFLFEIAILLYLFTPFVYRCLCNRRFLGNGEVKVILPHREMTSAFLFSSHSAMLLCLFDKKNLQFVGDAIICEIECTPFQAS